MQSNAFLFLITVPTAAEANDSQHKRHRNSINFGTGFAVGDAIIEELNETVLCCDGIQANIALTGTHDVPLLSSLATDFYKDYNVLVYASLIKLVN